MWSEKHRPRTLLEMVGNEDSRAKAVQWLARWNVKSRPLLLTGPPGTGKTTLVHVAAAVHGYNMVELNASDARSKSRLASILDPMKNNDALAGRTLLFIDEVDGIHGRADYGGASALLQFLKGVAFPVVMASNSEDVGKMKSIISASVHLRFKPIPPRLLRMHLMHILSMESVNLGPGIEIRTVSESRGDVRSLLNRAQALSGGLGPATETVPPAPDLGDAITAFFGAGSGPEAADVLYQAAGNPHEKIGALYSSVVNAKVDHATRADMLDAISGADVLYGRILTTQNWRLLRYLDSILAGAYKNDVQVRYERFSIDFSTLNKIRFDGPRIRALNSALAGALHTSSGIVAALVLPYYTKMVTNGMLDADPEHAEIIVKEAKSS